MNEQSGGVDQEEKNDGGCDGPIADRSVVPPVDYLPNQEAHKEERSRKEQVD